MSSKKISEKERLLQELTELRLQVSKLQESEEEHRRTKEILQKQTHALGERVKELNCLYEISSLVEKHGISLDKTLHGIVNIIPSAWQYPDITCAKLTVGDRDFATDNYRHTRWEQSSKITVRGKEIGYLTVRYLRKRPKCDEGPFLKEERNLVNVLAKRIGEIIERKQAEDALVETMARNKALLNAIPDIIFRVDKNGVILDFKSGKATSTSRVFNPKRVIGNCVFGFHDYFRIFPKEFVQQGMKNVIHVIRTRETRIYEHRFERKGNTYHFEVLLTPSGKDEVLGIIRDITERRRLEKQVIEISESEQQRIGQDLHDSLCQQLAGAAYLGKALQQKMLPTSPGASQDIGEIVSLIDDAITQTKDLARGLYPVRIEAGGLMSALSQLSHNVQKFFGIPCEFIYDAPVLIHDNITAVHLYRIAQEAVNNAIKHGNARSVSIILSHENSTVTLAVKNTGRIFRKIASVYRGMGINTMKHRAGMIGASLDIKSDREHGTVVSCVFQKNKTIKIKKGVALKDGKETSKHRKP